MSHEQLRILIADDDREDLELIEESLLHAAPAAVLLTVKNGRAAIEFLNTAKKTELPSLIVLDYSMPELNGLEALTIICNDIRFDGIPVVILSTSDSPTHIEACKNRGAADYFVKPSTLAEVDTIARKIIALCN